MITALLLILAAAVAIYAGLAVTKNERHIHSTAARR